MKAAAFAYSRPASVEEACALLAADDGARLIAGGQTLVPLMAMRLAAAAPLIGNPGRRWSAWARRQRGVRAGGGGGGRPRPTDHTAAGGGGAPPYVREEADAIA